MNRGGLQFAALILGLASRLALAAQPGVPQLRFQHLSVEEGLSIARTYAVLKDSRGFLWVGTEDGLNRYDGSSIVVHRARLGDVHSLASSQVRALFEDEQKRLWVGASSRSSRFGSPSRLSSAPWPVRPPSRRCLRAVPLRRRRNGLRHGSRGPGPRGTASGTGTGAGHAAPRDQDVRRPLLHGQRPHVLRGRGPGSDRPRRAGAPERRTGPAQPAAGGRRGVNEAQP